MEEGKRIIKINDVAKASQMALVLGLLFFILCFSLRPVFPFLLQLLNWLNLQISKFWENFQCLLLASFLFVLLFLPLWFCSFAFHLLLNLDPTEICYSILKFAKLKLAPRVCRTHSWNLFMLLLPASLSSLADSLQDLF